MSGPASRRLKVPAVESLPGLLLCIAIAALGVWLASVPWVANNLHLGALLLIIMVGMVWRVLLPPPSWTSVGIEIAQKPILRWGVALLGFKISVGQLASVGPTVLLIVMLCTVGAFYIAVWLGKVLGIDPKFSALLGVGGAICGASAIVAADSVINAEKKQVAASLGVITLLGTIGIALYPYIGHLLSLDARTFGVWDGASLHEVAQVVAAGQAYGEDALQVATIVKMARICLLIPIVFVLGWQIRTAGSGKAISVNLVPWFLIAFLAFVGVTSVNVLPDRAIAGLGTASLWLLGIGMAGVGLQTGFADIKNAGWKPILVASIQWVALAASSLVLARLLLA